MKNKRANLGRNVKDEGQKKFSLSVPLARRMRILEIGIEAFSLLLVSLGVVIVAALLGAFDQSYPWAQLALFSIFVIWTLHCASKAKFRIMGLKAGAPKKLSWSLWALYLARKLKFWAETAGHEIFVRVRASRAAFVCGAVLCVVLTGWGLWGGLLLARVNPDLQKKWHRAPLDMNAWVAPPSYVSVEPLLIATPSGVRQPRDVLQIPEESEIHVHVSGAGAAPVLQANGSSYKLELDDHGDFATTQKIVKGDSLSLSRGWESLGYWRIHVLHDQAPKAAFTAVPTVSERKAVSLSYEATDDNKITSLSLIIAPVGGDDAAKGEPVIVPLSAPALKHLNETVYVDLTSSPYAGMPVIIQLRAEDGAGQEGVSPKIALKLPERQFTHPVAQALVEERKQLFLHDDFKQRDEVANVMAGIAHQQMAYRSDEVVMMSLRAGAMRLVLDQTPESVKSVGDLLWQSAVRIEDGVTGLAREALRKAQMDMAAALDAEAPADVLLQNARKINQALNRYLSKETDRVVHQAAAQGDLVSMRLSTKDQTLVPSDLVRMLDELRQKCADEDRDAVRKQLTQLQSLFENMRAEPLVLSVDQKKLLLQLNALKNLTVAQQKLMEETTHVSQFNNVKDRAKRMAERQKKILQNTAELTKSMTKVPDKIVLALRVMPNVRDHLENEQWGEAAQNQEIIVKLLRLGMLSLLDGLPKDLIAGAH